MSLLEGLVGFWPLAQEVAGQDLFDPDKGDYETDTEGWAAQGTNIIEASTDIAKTGSKSMKCTYVDSATGAILYFRDSLDLGVEPVVGKKYRVTAWIAVGPGDSVQIRLHGGVSVQEDQTWTSETMAFFTGEFILETVNVGRLYFSMGAGEVVYVDDVHITEVYTPNLVQTRMEPNPDLFDEGAGDFEVDIGSWITYGTNVTAVSTDIAYKGSKSLKITYVDNADGAYVFMRDAHDLITNLTVGKKYRLILWAAVGSGSVDIVLTNAGDTTLATVTSTSMVKVEADFIAATIGDARLHMGNMGAGEIIYIDDIRLTEVLPTDPQQWALGPDLFDEGAGGFETDTESWTPHGGNSIEASTDKSHSGNQSLKTTYVNHGSGAYVYLRDSDDLVSDLVVGRKYRITLWAAVNVGSSVDVRVLTGVGGVVILATITSETMVEVVGEFIAAHATDAYISMLNMSAGEILYLDDISIQEVPPTPLSRINVGPDLFDSGAGGFETDIGGWVVYGTNTAVVSTDIAHTGLQSLKITYVDNGEGAYLWWRDATDLVGDLTVGKKYRITGWAALGAVGSVSILNSDGVNAPTVAVITGTTMVRFTHDFIALHASDAHIRMANMSGTDIIYLDDISIQEVYDPLHATVDGPTLLDGGGYFFDGIDDWMRLVGSGNITGEAFTVAVKATLAAWANFRTLIGKENAPRLQFSDGSPSKLWISDAPDQAAGAGLDLNSGTTNILLNREYWLIAVMEFGTNKYKLFIDSIEEDQGSLTSVLDEWNANDWTIGRPTVVAGTNHSGNIYELAFWDRGLNQQEVHEVVNGKLRERFEDVLTKTTNRAQTQPLVKSF